MSIHSEDYENGDQASEGGDQGQGIKTPKVEAPISLRVSKPATGTTDEVTRAFVTPDNYFAPQPLSYDQQQGQNPRTRSPSTRPVPSVGASDVTASGQLHLPDSAFAAVNPPRPAPHTSPSTYSIQSVESNTTITANSANSSFAAATQRRPAFPNQAFSALHTQQYPTPHVPPTLRQRSSHPGQIYTFSSAFARQDQQGSRTVGHSPAVTPGSNGLFNPAGAPSPPLDYDSPVTPGTYASPFLHFTHRVPPKETHVADVDVDPISGRKLINHYEIIDELGRGTHGKVKLGRDLNTENTYVAIKIVERFSKRRKLGRLGTTEDKVKKEVAILKNARHPNIVALLEVIDDPSRKKVYIVLEWVERGEIQWRVKGPKEIAMVEARRYEREKNGRHNAQSEAEDEAVLTEAQRRLTTHRRRQRRSFRRIRREASDDPESWSIEMMGGEESDVSEDDGLSRASTVGGESYSSRLPFDENRQLPRAASPTLSRSGDEIISAIKKTVGFLSLTAEPQSASPTRSSYGAVEFSDDDLAGTMYGAYDSPSVEISRVPSTADNLNSQAPSRHDTKNSSDDLRGVATEILDSELNSELEYVPVMSMQQIRVAFRDTLLGLQYLHYQGIVHRDIKPPNLLTTKDQRVKISDFGVSYLGRPIHEGEPGEDVSEHEAVDLEDEAKELAKTVGTPAFYAPELCITEPMEDSPPITKAIDVWALGVTLFCMLFARTPFVDNEFVVMRQIADEEIYIPRKRLQPPDVNLKSRPSSRGRTFPPPLTGFRNEHDLLYEDLGDDLHDLLKGLLTKDPRKRITLEEVRHQPWVTADLPNRAQWLEETDQSRQSQGKKIEVSQEDMNTAVVPLQFLDRVRSGIKKVLGFGGKPNGRDRARSNAALGSYGSPGTSAASSSSNISQVEGRRKSLRGDEYLFTALKAYREGDHPLSRSVNASPDLNRLDTYDRELESVNTRPESALGIAEYTTPSRPSPPERASTVMATSGSMRTVKQSDFRTAHDDQSPPPSPGLPETPTHLESPPGLSSGWGGGMARRILKTVRERSAGRPLDMRAPSSERSSVGSIDGHGEPSIALSQTTASGQVTDAFAPSSVSSSAHGSPTASGPLSVLSSSSADRLQPPQEQDPLSRTSSGRSAKSVSWYSVDYDGSINRSPSQRQKHVSVESSAEDWQRAEDEHIRKLIREQQDRQHAPASFDERLCPESPDDLVRRPQNRRISVLDIANPESPHGASSPTGAQFPPAMVSSSSDFGSAASMSVSNPSNPSIPSVISEASSIVPTPLEQPENESEVSSNETLPSKARLGEEIVDEGYTPDPENAESSDNEDYDSSSDSDGGLVMTRRRSAARQSGSKRHGSLAEALRIQARPKERRGTGSSGQTVHSNHEDALTFREE